MTSLNFKDVSFSDFEIVELITIYFFRDRGTFYQSDDLEIHDEVLKRGDDTFH